MSEIQELEGRITAALNRIRGGLDGMSAAPAAAPAETGDAAGLAQQLDDERVANEQLQERVKLLKERQDGKMAELEHRVEAQRAQMANLDAELQRLRASNAEMREVNAQLRSAATDGMAEPEMLNRAMMAEIDALQAQRSADAAEVTAILSELKPLIEEA